MGWLGRWLRTTLDYNPTFPLSALLLMLGLRLLVNDGTLDADSVARTGGGLGVVQAYELLLLGAAVLVLWPRRIAYETTSVLIVQSVVRWAGPFLVASHAAEGHPIAATLYGSVLVALMAAKGAAVQAKVGLDLRRWERGYDLGLFAGASVGLPLLAWWLSDVTGGSLSHEAARGVHVAAWWTLAAILAPLSQGLPDLGTALGALKSRRPAAVWRALCLASAALLAGNALWLGGDGPTAFALLPLALVATAVGATIARAGGIVPGAWLAHVPAAAAAPFLLLPMPELAGKLALPRTVALLFVLPACAALLPLVAPADVRRGLRSLGAVAALAPLAVAGSFRAAEPWLALVAVTITVVGAWRRDDRALAAGAVGSTLLAAHLLSTGMNDALTVLLLGGASLSGLVAWRDPEGALAPTAATLQVLGAGALVAVRGPDAMTGSVALLSALALCGLGWRRGERGLIAAGAGLALAILGRSGAVDPGVALVLLAFAAVPAGAALAVRRERARAVAEPLPDWAVGQARRPEPVDLGLFEMAPAAVADGIADVRPAQAINAITEEDEVEREAAALAIPGEADLVAAH